MCTVSQLNLRFVRNFYPDYQTSKVKFLIGKIRSNEKDFELNTIEYINGVQSKEEDVTIDLGIVEKGEYMAYIMIDWWDDEVFKTFEFRTYSNNEVVN